MLENIKRKEVEWGEREMESMQLQHNEHRKKICINI